ncbi:MAG: C10 family peptidase [Muribaculaceae bacterium]|nr:C10 family peptidase [Muribaculaceae bacterium]
MKKQLLLLFITIYCCCGFISKSEIINLEKAHDIASNFRKGNSITRGNLDKNNIILEHVALTPIKKEIALYIFKCEDGGFIIVSGDTSTDHEILAYSDYGDFNFDQCNPAVKKIIDSYAIQIENIRKTSIKSTRSSGNIINGDQSDNLPTNVDPLIKTHWHQNSPFNNFCPELDGSTTPTGCVATTLAQIMYYHRYPNSGVGEYSYEWNGQILSRDFSQSEYNWDKMLLEYTRGKYTKEEGDEVARLMYDIGVAFEMNYGLNGSGTNINTQNLHDFFGYDLGVVVVYQEWCSQQDWKNILKNEIADGFPVPYGNNGHMFICDGYDSKDYFHFNFGWGGNSDGYYLIDISNENPYISIPSAYIYTRIQKDVGGSGRAFIYSKGNFIHLEDNILRLVIDRSTQGLLLIDYFIKAEEINTKEKYYQKISLNPTDFAFSMELPDGHYTLTPILREQNSMNDIKIHFGDRFQNSVDLVVENGECFFSNLTYQDIPKEGTVEIGGIFYEFPDNKLSANVTYKNEFNSYSGEVTIPSYIEYKNKTYSVGIIGENAFKDCENLKTVTIGANIREIESYAFENAYSMENVNFDKSSVLSKIGWAAFFSCYELKTIKLPDNLIYLDGWSFAGCLSLESITLPKKLKELGRSTFGYCYSLKEIILPIATPIEAIDLFCDIDPQDIQNIKVYVPVGCKSVYKSSQTWGGCEIIDNINLDDAGVENIVEDPDETLSIYTIDGILLKRDGKKEDFKNLDKGVYIIVSGKERYKISI